MWEKFVPGPETKHPGCQKSWKKSQKILYTIFKIISNSFEQRVSMDCPHVNPFGIKYPAIAHKGTLDGGKHGSQQPLVRTHFRLQKQLFETYLFVDLNLFSSREGLIKQRNPLELTIPWGNSKK